MNTQIHGTDEIAAGRAASRATRRRSTLV